MVCAEPLDLSDQNFKPCPCGLDVSVLCLLRVLRDASRKLYSQSDLPVLLPQATPRRPTLPRMSSQVRPKERGVRAGRL